MRVERRVLNACGGDSSSGVSRILFGDTGCDLYFDHFDHHHVFEDDVDAQPFYPDGALPQYELMLDHAVAAEGSILGVDADGVGNQW